MRLSRWIFPICFFVLSVAFAAPPQRIVSIAPGFTETLYALGLDQEIVGTTNFCDYPEKAKHTEKIGDVVTPNLEKIISLKPDLVLCGKWKWQLPENLRKVGIKVLEIADSTKLQDTYETILLIGEAVGRKDRAQQLVARMKDQAVKLQSERKLKKTVYVELDAGNWTVGGTSYLNELLQLAGLTNIFADRKEPYMMVTLESIVSRDPDLVISLSRKKSDIQKEAAWQSLRAVQSGMILDKTAIDWNAVTRQSPRILEGVENLRVSAEKLFQ